MGITEFDGEAWQLVFALTSESTPKISKEGGLRIVWTGATAGMEKWLFLHVKPVGDERFGWSFAFDCNEAEVVVFLRRLLRDNRLMLAFPDQRAVPLEGVADKLRERFADTLESYFS